MRCKPERRVQDEVEIVRAERLPGDDVGVRESGCPSPLHEDGTRQPLGQSAPLRPIATEIVPIHPSSPMPHRAQEPRFRASWMQLSYDVMTHTHFDEHFNQVLLAAEPL